MITIPLGFFKNNSSAIDLPSLLVKMTPLSIDASAVSEDDAIPEWTDLKSGYDATVISTYRPQLHIESGERQVEFVAANLDFLSIPHANVNFVPGTNEFTIIVKIGHVIDPSTVTQYIFAKAQLNLTASGQYAFYVTGGTLRATVGGTNLGFTAGTVSAGDIFALVVRTTGADLYKNNVKIYDNVAIGTVTTTNDLIIGGRYTGASSPMNGSLSHFLIYNTAITSTEYNNIYNEIL